MGEGCCGFGRRSDWRPPHEVEALVPRHHRDGSAARGPHLSGGAAVKYRTIVADPPWRYTKATLDSYAPGTAEGEYGTLAVSEIAHLPIRELVADDAHLYLWVTNPILTEQRTDAGALSVVRAWGFEPKTILTWHKLGGAGMGWYFRGDTEHVIFAVRGRGAIAPALRVSNHFAAAKGRHSAKPDRFYEIVERVSPEPRLELFARRRRYGWDVWGNEAPTEQASQATLDLEGVA